MCEGPATHVPSAAGPLSWLQLVPKVRHSPPQSSGLLQGSAQASRHRMHVLTSTLAPSAPPKWASDKQLSRASWGSNILLAEQLGRR